jgi:uncharacterized protein
MTNLPQRVHVIAGGFPPGAAAGHDHDYARLRLLGLLAEHEFHASVANDFHDIERWLPISRMLITYVAGPYMTDEQAKYVRNWLSEGGRWLGLHGTAGGRAARIEGTRQRAMVKAEHHEVLGGFFINHPPVRKFQVDVAAPSHPLVEGLERPFVTVDEPYMIEVLHPERSTILLTAELGPDASPPGFGFRYEKDTALMPDGKTRALAYTTDVGEGGVTYVALGHAHTPSTNSQPFVDKTVDPEGKTPPYVRTTWETPEYERLLRNSIAWGLRG